MATVTVLGAGMMGSALCVPLADRGHEVRLVGTHLDGEIVASLAASHHHPTLGLELPESIQPLPVSQLAKAIDGADLVALGVSSAGARWAGEQLAPRLPEDVPVVMITKGLDWDGASLRTMPEVVRTCLPETSRAQLHPAAIAGPCIAGELARRVPSCVVVTGQDQATLDRIVALLRADYYHLWTSTDVTGVETCAALKNAYAMGIAFGTGMHLARGGSLGSVAMHNVESAVFAQAVREMRQWIRLAGGDPESAIGLAGVGDLDVTNNGGRTGRFGALLGQGLSRGDAIREMKGATLECLEILAVMREATRALEQAGQLASGSMPLLEHLAEVALDGAPVALPLHRFFGEDLTA
ncbi:MAG: glycerol-3-phosphate dehydrogenase [Deltaproteobacteria bacterium]|jgi:glycerol-3-phosphate dehydrogenase (NAD(P)+)|nr:glycerol-3-phosphate dehydrogenase [Deltaproteobacteria bacterium]MBW2535080.1 glycerol-3-phosphate dehydrogenase [Deltaproteobacteria bacterium]